MQTSTARLIEAIRARTTTRSDYAVAKALGISTQRMSKYMHGRDELHDADAIARGAEFLGDDPGVWLAEFQAERAKTPAAAIAWKRLADLARAAGIPLYAGAFLLGATVAPRLEANPLPSQALSGGSSSGPVYIMSILRALRRRRLLRFAEREILGKTRVFRLPAQLPLFLSGPETIPPMLH